MEWGTAGLVGRMARAMYRPRGETVFLGGLVVRNPKIALAGCWVWIKTCRRTCRHRAKKCRERMAAACRERFAGRLWPGSGLLSCF